MPTVSSLNHPDKLLASICEWQTIAGCNSVATDLIRSGARFHWLAGPPRRRIDIPNPPAPTPEAHTFMTNEVASLLESGRIAKWTASTPPKVVSPVFAVQQREKYRLVFNFRAGNLRQRRPPHFKMQGWQELAEQIGPGDRMCKADLEAAYHLVRMHPSTRPYMAFRWEGQVYVWLVMPFGWAWAPFLFTKLMAPVMRHLRRAGLRTVIYLDDILLIVRGNEVEMARQVELFKETMARLNLPLKESKCILTPQATIEFLGVNVDNTGQTTVLQVPTRKRRDTAKAAKRLLAASHVKVKRLAQWAGWAQHLTTAFLPTRNHLVATHDLINTARSWSARVQLNEAIKEELRWWVAAMGNNEWDGRTLVRARDQPHWILTTDASPWGWGATVRSPTGKEPEWATQEQWTPAEREAFHINELELMAIHRALERWRPCDTYLALLTDNTTALAAVRRCFGGNPRLRSTAMLIHGLLRRNNTVLVSSAYISTLENTRADALSRGWSGERRSMEFPLDRAWAEALQRRWGRCSIDLFATPANTKSPRFFSLHPHPAAAAVDAMAQQWAAETRAWCNPPFGMLSKVINKLAADRPTAGAILITPDWPHATWWPTASAMSIVSVQLPSSTALDTTEMSAATWRRTWPWNLRAWWISPRA